MNASSPVRRRDGRFRFNTEEACVELTDTVGRTISARLLDLSAAGLGFELHGSVELQAGMLIENAIVRVGRCALRGALAIRNARTPAPGQIRCGCLFYPESPEVEIMLMSLLTGLESSGGLSPDRAPAAVAG